MHTIEPDLYQTISPDWLVSPFACEGECRQEPLAISATENAPSRDEMRRPEVVGPQGFEP
jgi:hypothetical protein